MSDNLIFFDETFNNVSGIKVKDTDNNIKRYVKELETIYVTLYLECNTVTFTYINKNGEQITSDLTHKSNVVFEVAKNTTSILFWVGVDAFPYPEFTPNSIQYEQYQNGNNAIALSKSNNNYFIYLG